jgi:hypothetical protein
MIDRRVVQLGCVDPTSWDRVLSLLFDFVYSRSKGPIIFMNSCFSYYFYVPIGTLLFRSRNVWLTSLVTILYIYKHNLHPPQTSGSYLHNDGP